MIKWIPEGFFTVDGVNIHIWFELTHEGDPAEDVDNVINTAMPVHTYLTNIYYKQVLEDLGKIEKRMILVGTENAIQFFKVHPVYNTPKLIKIFNKPIEVFNKQELNVIYSILLKAGFKERKK